MPHAAGVGGDFAIKCEGHVDAFNSGSEVRFFTSEVFQSGREADEFEAGHEFVRRLVFGHDADAFVDIVVSARVSAEEPDLAFGSGVQAANHAEQGSFASAVGAEESSYAGSDLQGDVADRDDVAEPFGYGVKRHDGVIAGVGGYFGLGLH